MEAELRRAIIEQMARSTEAWLRRTERLHRQLVGPALKEVIGLAEQRVYLGQRTPAGPVVTVQTGRVEQMLQHHPIHSPTGFEWGYHGSGPSDLAYAILSDLAGWEYAERHHRAFRRDVVAALAREGFVLTEGDVRFWIERHPMDGRVVAGTEGNRDAR